jgi:hypothetical protein
LVVTVNPEKSHRAEITHGSCPVTAPGGLQRGLDQRQRQRKTDGGSSRRAPAASALRVMGRHLHPRGSINASGLTDRPTDSLRARQSVMPGPDRAHRCGKTRSRWPQR